MPPVGVLDNIRDTVEVRIVIRSGNDHGTDNDRSVDHRWAHEQPPSTLWSPGGPISARLLRICRHGLNYPASAQAELRYRTAQRTKPWICCELATNLELSPKGASYPSHPAVFQVRSTYFAPPGIKEDS